MNTNLLPDVADSDSSKLINVCEIFGLSQLITEPTRVTAQSQSLIDLCITNTPDKIVRMCWNASASSCGTNIGKIKKMRKTFELAN